MVSRASAFDVADVVAAAVVDPGPVPTSGPELVRYAGGRRELAKQLSGMDRAPRKGEYATEDEYRIAHTRWRSASRQAQRWDAEGKAGKQTRGHKKPIRLPEDSRDRLEADAADRKFASMWNRGARMRLEAMIQVKSPGPGKRQEPPRLRVLPAGGPGVWITEDELTPVLVATAKGDQDEASFELLAAFGEAYQWDMRDAEIVEIIRVKVWPEGTREPA